MYIIAILFLFLSGCAHQQENVAYYQGVKGVKQEAKKITDAHDNYVATLGFYPFLPEERVGPEIGKVSRHFITKNHRIESVDAARDFFCAFLERYLACFNQRRSLRPYLTCYPLTFETVDLQIVFVDENDKPVMPPSFWSIRKVDQTLFYEIFDKKINKSVAFQTESAARAMRIYRAKK